MTDTNDPGAAADANRFAPPLAPVADAPATQDAFVLAGRGARLGAVLIDGIIGLAVSFPIMFLLFGSFNTMVSAQDRLRYMVVGTVVYFVLQGWLIARRGQTIGKRIVGLRMVRPDGSRLDFGRYVGLRFLPVFLLTQVPFIGGIVALVDCLMIFRANRRTLHDVIADTVVATADSTEGAVAA